MKTHKIILLVILAFIILIVMLLVNIHRDASKRSLQTDGFDLTHFLILIFPANEYKDLSPERAYLVSIDEYTHDSIEVYKDNNMVKIQKSDLTASPLTCNTSILVNNLNAEISKWGKDTDWESVEYKYEIIGDLVEISLKLNYKSGDYEIFNYTYQSDGLVLPKSIKSKPGGHL